MDAIEPLLERMKGIAAKLEAGDYAGRYDGRESFEAQKRAARDIQDAIALWLVERVREAVLVSNPAAAPKS